MIAYSWLWPDPEATAWPRARRVKPLPRYVDLETPTPTPTPTRRAEQTGETMPQGKQGDYHKRARLALTERKRVVRALLVEGTSEFQIIRTLIKGYRDDYGVAVEGVSESTARRALNLVAEEFRGLFDSEDHADREIGAAFDRMKRIALKAEQAKQYGHALSANDRIIRLLAPRSKRWAHVLTNERPLVGAGSVEPPKAQPGMSDVLTAEVEELVKERKTLHERLAKVGLVVHEGEKKAAG